MNGKERDDHERIDSAIMHQRMSTFWFANRQPRYMKELTGKWGEFFDDQVVRPEQEGFEYDLD